MKDFQSIHKPEKPGNMIQRIKDRLDYKTKIRINKKISNFKALFVWDNLTTLAKIYHTDKWGRHFYTPHYQAHFSRFRLKKFNFLEIGVGGYEDPYSGGNSLRMWRSYFPYAKIFSLDIYDKSPQEERRIKIFRGSQVDLDFLQSVCDRAGEFDIIVDDGSHLNEHVITSFEFLFPKLKPGGIYVVEDTQTSYWPNYGGSSEDFGKKGTIYTYFKSLIDGLNHDEFLIEGYQKTYYDQNITSIHFYHNMIFIHKGDNNEGSNIVVNNRMPEKKTKK